MTPDEIEKMKADIEAGTPGPWKSRGMGGDSVVLSERHKYHKFSEAYDAYPISIPRTYFDDELDWLRVDHQAAGFSHADARRIARVPELEAEVLRLRDALREIATGPDHLHDANVARAALNISARRRQQ